MRRIYGNLPQFAMLLLWIAIPVAVMPYDGGWFSVKGMAMGCVQGFLPAAVVTLLLSFIPKKSFRATCWTVILALFGLVCLAEVFIGISLNTRINDAVLMLIRQSDASESKEFVEYTFGQPYIYKAAVVTLSPLVLGGILAAFKPCRLRRRNAEFKYLYALALAVSTVALIYCNRPLLRSQKTLADTYMLTLPRLVAIMQPLEDVNNTIQSLYQANASTSVEVVGTQAPLIIVVIGESDNKRHNSLYGYHRPTSAALSSLVDSVGFVLMEDAVSGDKTTSLVMKQLFTTPAVPERPWECKPLLPAALKAGGYAVGYFDNQSEPNTCSDVDYSSVFFLNNPLTGPQSFDLRNNQRYRFDSQLIDSALASIASLPQPAVLFIHLMGQHIRASERYDHADAQFTLNDYTDRNDLTEAQRADVMHYDNSTACLSENLRKIVDNVSQTSAIVIYLADHGEEIYDFRAQYGRTQEPVTSDLAKVLFEVPMWVYMTHGFRESFPEKADAIKRAASLPFHTYNLPNLVLDLGALRIKDSAGQYMSVDSLSIASPVYAPQSVRLIHNQTIDYDKIVNN